MKVTTVQHMNQIINCADCKRFRKYFTLLNALRKIMFGMSNAVDKLDQDRYEILSEFYEHIDTHFEKEKKN